MKILSTIATVFVLSGCSHAYVRQQDSDHVVACCPSKKIFCTASSLEDMAKDSCGGEVELMSSGTQNTNSYSVQRNFYNGEVLGVSQDTEKCSAFKCQK
jgi:hypothetical protein